VSISKSIKRNAILVVVLALLIQPLFSLQAFADPVLKWDKPWVTTYKDGVSQSQRVFTNTGSSVKTTFTATLPDYDKKWTADKEINIESGQSYIVTVKAYYHLDKTLVFSTNTTITITSEYLDSSIPLLQLGMPRYYDPYVTVSITKVAGSGSTENNSASAQPKPAQEQPAQEQPAQEKLAVNAIRSSVKVLVDGSAVAFDAYNINGSNYFKLRDLAMALNGTNKPFEVVWDDKAKAISLISGKKYTPVGGELSPGSGIPEVKAILTDSKIFLDGSEVFLTAYNIGGNNYFKLRDVAKAFNFGVTWDSTTSTIGIDTSTGYVE